MKVLAAYESRKEIKGILKSKKKKKKVKFGKSRKKQRFSIELKT